MRAPTPTPKRPAAALLATAVIGSLLGCIADNKRAGVDEFPNSIYARVNTLIDQGGASALSPVPSLADTVLDNSGFDLRAAKTAAGKIAAGQGEASSFAGALAKAAASGCTSGTLTFIDTVPDSVAHKVVVNTFSICADAKAFDSIKGNETVIHAHSVTTYNSGRVETADISDGDSDGVVNPLPGHAAKANIVFTVLDKGVLEKTVLVIGPGPDGSFDTEADNLVYSAAWSRTSGSDTLASAAYSDADSDGVAVDNGKASTVDLDFYQKGPSADHPDAAWSRAKLRLVVRYHVDAKQVKRVHFEMQDKAGRYSLGEVLGLDGGADFDMRDTVRAHFLTTGAGASDSLDTLDVNLKMTLGQDFDSKLDDSIYAIDIHSKLKLGEERDVRFTFTSDKPMPSGKDPSAGSLSLAIVYADSTQLSVDGKLTADEMDVTVKDRQGKRMHVVWDRQGHGLELQNL